MRWNRANVDVWGPKLVIYVNRYTHKLHIMTMVDPVTGWFEQQQLHGDQNVFVCK